MPAANTKPGRSSPSLIGSLDSAFVATLMDLGVEFVAVDNPHANKLTIDILAAVAEHEREAISERTRAALAAAKATGKAAWPARATPRRAVERPPVARKAQAAQFAGNVLALFRFCGRWRPFQ